MARTQLEGAVGERPKPGNKVFNAKNDVKKVPLYPAAEGAWQIYYLSPEWIEANLPAPQPVSFVDTNNDGLPDTRVTDIDRAKRFVDTDGDGLPDTRIDDATTKYVDTDGDGLPDQRGRR